MTFRARRLASAASAIDFDRRLRRMSNTSKLNDVTADARHCRRRRRRADFRRHGGLISPMPLIAAMLAAFGPRADRDTPHGRPALLQAARLPAHHRHADAQAHRAHVSRVAKRGRRRPHQLRAPIRHTAASVRARQQRAHHARRSEARGRRAAHGRCAAPRPMGFSANKDASR